VSERWVRRLLWLLLFLALAVVGASSYLRLAGNGLGCEPWPTCYATTAAFDDAQQSTAVQALRLAHRVAASAFLVAALIVVALAWRTWRGAQRGAGVVLLAVTFALALIGRLTPSALPWVTWLNVLGGFALVALVLWLLWPPQHEEPANGIATVVLLGLLVAQVIGGTLISSRLAAAACDPACAHEPAGAAMALFNPLRPGNAVEVAGAASAANVLHAMHRIAGLALALAALGWTATALRRPATYITLATIAVLVVGTALTHGAGPAAGAAHALAAALLLAVLARALPIARR
jgi:cytochrome c oxidase assembly protein subunit 15